MSQSGDGQLVADLLAVEEAVSVAYREAMRSDQLGPRARRLVRLFEGHEREHGRALRQELRVLSPSPSKPPIELAAAQKLLAAHRVTLSPQALRSENDCLRLLGAVEAVAVGAYFRAMSMLRAPRLLRLSAEIMASEAQHAALIGELLYPSDIARATPDPFVQGAP